MNLLFWANDSFTKQANLPSWYGEAKSYLKELNGDGIFNNDINWYRKWNENIIESYSTIDSIDIIRKQVYACIPEAFNKKAVEIAGCQSISTEKDVVITQLNKQIKVLEEAVSSLTQIIINLENDIQNAALAIKVLLDMQDDKIDDLEAALYSLRNKHTLLTQERDLFRIILNRYYQQLALDSYQDIHETEQVKKELCVSSP